MLVHRDDVNISYSVIGNGPDVVLLHPFPVSHEFWLPVAEKLSLRYRVILVDLRGFGASTLGTGPATMQKQADDVAAVCREAKVTKAVFGGVSMGGYILFEFWRRHPQLVRGLMLCDTKAAPDTEEARNNRLKAAEDVLQRGPDAFLDSMVPKLLGESTRRNRPDLAARARRMMQQSPQAIAAAQQGMAARPDSIPTLSSVNVPTLIVVGDEDTLTPVVDAQLLNQRIKGSQFQVLPQAGHYAVYEKADDAIRIIRGFLDSLVVD